MQSHTALLWGTRTQSRRRMVLVVMPPTPSPRSRDLLWPVFLTRSGGMQMEAGELSEAEVELEVVEPWDTRVNMFGA